MCVVYLRKKSSTKYTFRLFSHYLSLSLPFSLSLSPALYHYLPISHPLSPSPSHYAIIVISDIHGDTPLHAATSAGNEIILYLILTLIMIIITYLLILTN